MTKKCIECKVNPPEVPDRNREGRPIKRICRQCHVKRLLGDLEYCVAVEANRKRRYEQQHNPKGSTAQSQ